MSNPNRGWTPGPDAHELYVDEMEANHSREERMKTKHTPGPWNIMPSKRSALIHIETDATCEAGAGIPICSIPGNNLSNALLIAAAPELLEALSGMLSNYIELKRISLLMAKSDAPNWVGSTLTVKDDVHIIAARAAILKALT